MIKMIKIRLYPNEKVKNKFDKTIEAARFAYNWGLNIIIECIKNKEKWPSGYTLQSMFTKFKKLPGNEWLYETDSSACAKALLDLATACKFFKKGLTKFPKFKSKKDGYRTKGFDKSFKQNILKHIKLLKIGSIKYKGIKNLPNHILNITVKRKSNKYYGFLTYEDNNYTRINTNKKCGIDTGIRTFATLSDSDGNHEKITHYLPNQRELRRLKLLQRSISRKPSDSNNRTKTILKLQNKHDKITNKIQDQIHKITSRIVTSYDEIKIEDVNPKNWVSPYAKKANERLYYQSIGTFYRQLEYKSEWYGASLIKISKFFPSSQICSNCGFKNSKLRDRNIHEWTCSNCNSYHDRDINASINILNYQ